MVVGVLYHYVGEHLEVQPLLVEEGVLLILEIVKFLKDLIEGQGVQADNFLKGTYECGRASSLQSIVVLDYLAAREAVVGVHLGADSGEGAKSDLGFNRFFLFGNWFLILTALNYEAVLN
jgi:hypothetical protein